MWAILDLETTAPAAAAPARLCDLPCLAEGCDRLVGTGAKGMCLQHYKRARRGSLKAGPITRPQRRPCTVSGCDKPHLAKGYCSKHYQQQTPPKKRRPRHNGPCIRCRGDRGPGRVDNLCQDCRAAGTKRWAERNPERARELAARSARKGHARRRILCIRAYGGSCACCGEGELAFMAIDHIDGGGNAHRRSLSSTGKIVGAGNFYGWLVRNNFPPGFQVLCHNCNFAKSHGGCPHEYC